MNTKDLATIFLALLVPVLTTLLGLAGVAFQDWRTSRSRIGRRKLMLDDARAQVSFVADWWAAQKSLEPSPEALQEARTRVKAFLDHASAAVSATKLPLPEAEPPLTIRRLFLLYPFASLAGDVVRAAFFVFSGVTLIMLGASVSEQLLLEPGRMNWVNIDLIAGGFTAACALGLRFLAVKVEQDAASAVARGESGRGFVRRTFLLYALHRRSANVVRVLFYVGLLGLVQYDVMAAQLSWRMWTLAYLPAYAATSAATLWAVLGLRSWAVWLERRPTTTASESGTAAAPPPGTSESLAGTPSSSKSSREPASA
jgi:hypothetical protein